jgi:hypothetical protein
LCVSKSQVYSVGMLIFVGESGLQQMTSVYWANKNSASHRNVLMGLIANGPFHSLNCDFSVGKLTRITPYFSSK